MGEKGEADNALDPLDDMKAAIGLVIGQQDLAKHTTPFKMVIPHRKWLLARVREGTPLHWSVAPERPCCIGATLHLLWIQAPGEGGHDTLSSFSLL